MQAKLQAFVLFLVSRAFLQVVERIYAALRLARTGLRRAAHPFQLVFQQLAVTFCSGTLHFLTFTALPDIIVEIAVMGIHHALIEFKNLITHTVKEVAIVGHHEQCHARLSEEFLQPLHHLHVEVVGRLVEDEEIRLVQQYQGQSQTLHLSARQFINHLFQVVDGKTSQILPCLKMLLFVKVGQQVRNPRPCRINGQLLQVADFDVIGISDRPRIGRLLPHQDLQHRRLARAIGGNQRRLVALLNAKGDVFKQRLDAIRLGYRVDRQIVHFAKRLTYSMGYCDFSETCSTVIPDSNKRLMTASIGSPTSMIWKSGS